MIKTSYTYIATTSEDWTVATTMMANIFGRHRLEWQNTDETIRPFEVMSSRALKPFISSWEWWSEWSCHICKQKYLMSVWQSRKKNQRIRMRIIMYCHASFLPLHDSVRNDLCFAFNMMWYSWQKKKTNERTRIRTRIS